MSKLCAGYPVCFSQIVYQHAESSRRCFSGRGEHVGIPGHVSFSQGIGIFAQAVSGSTSKKSATNSTVKLCQ